MKFAKFYHPVLPLIETGSSSIKNWISSGLASLRWMVTLGRFPAKGCMYCNLLIVTEVLVTFIELSAIMSNWNRLRPVILTFHRNLWSVDHEIQIILILLKFADPQSRESCAFFSYRGGRQTRVTYDEEQGTMGRRKAEVHFFFPAFLCAQIFVERETFGTRQGTFERAYTRLRPQRKQRQSR